MEGIKWAYKLNNVDVLEKIKENGTLLHVTKKRKKIWDYWTYTEEEWTTCSGFVEGTVEGEEERLKLPDDVQYEM